MSMDRGRIILGLGIAYAAYTGYKFFYAPIKALDPGANYPVELDMAAVLINYQLDLKFDTHDPAKIPNYTQEVLFIGQQLAQNLGALQT